MHVHAHYRKRCCPNMRDLLHHRDKDVCLMKTKFGLDHIDYEHMSPVIIPRGYTKDYIDGKITHKDQLEKVMNSFKHVNEASDITLMEGTGNCAVGSIVGVNNAQVAAMLGADVVLVANGGLGEFVSFVSFRFSWSME